MNHSTIQLSKANALHNLLIFKENVGASLVAPVIKSNAYGHGFDEMTAFAVDENLPYLMVNYVSEAVRIRELGFTKSILVVGPVFDVQEYKDAAELDIQLTLSHFDSLKIWVSLRHKPFLHIKLDTGLNRQGFKMNDLKRLCEELQPYQEQLVGVSSHFANVEDVLDQKFALEQHMSFVTMKSVLGAELPQASFMPHMAASGASLLVPASRFNLCRVGISFYGLWPSELSRISFAKLHGREVQLKPVLSWHTKISQLKNLHTGEYIGYGCTFKAQSPMTIAVLPVGYYEGYARLCSDHKAYVLIQGTRCPVVGRICMNMMTVDVSHIPKVSRTDPVTLIGKDQGEEVTLDQIAGWSSTISYEAAVRLHPEIKKTWVP